MFDMEILKPRSMCKHTQLEKLISHQFGRCVKIFECKQTRKIRLVYCSGTSAHAIAVSALLLNPYNRVRTYQIDGVFTLKGNRRKGYAKQLLAVARYVIGTVKHSDNLTESGEAWLNSVEGLK